MDSDEKLPRRVPDARMLFACVGHVSSDGSNTRAGHDVHTGSQEPEGITHSFPPAAQTELLLPHSPPAVNLHGRSYLNLVAAFSSPRANHLVSILNTEPPLTFAQKADGSGPFTISVPQHSQLPITLLAGAGSQVPLLLCMSEPLQPVSDSSFFLPLLYGLPFLNMGPIVIAALGAGAFVTTAVAGVVLLRRKVLGKAVDVDVEKGLEENALERREPTGPGWKEFTEVDEKATSDLLVPLVAAFYSQREADVTDADPFRAPITPEPQLPTLHQCPDLPTPAVQQHVNPIPVLEGDISDTCNLDHAPVFPPGLPMPAKAVAVARPISARLYPLSELGSLDTGVAKMTSWPVLAPTPVEEMRTRSTGQGEQLVPDIKDDVVPQDESSAASPTSPCEQQTASSVSILPAFSGISDKSDEVDPFGDPSDSAHSPRSEVSLRTEDCNSPVCISQSVINSLDGSDPQPAGIGWSAGIGSVFAPSIHHPNPSIVVPDTVIPINIPLPGSPPMSPKAISPLLVHTLPLDAVAATTVIFGGELSPSTDVSDHEPSSPVIMAPTAPILAPIITTAYLEGGINEGLCSPFSDTGSSSGSDSSGPATPTELKHELPFSPALDLSSKDTPRLQLPVCLTLDEDAVIDEDIEVIDDFVIVGQQAPDPPSPAIDIISPEWMNSKLPGSFEAFEAPASGRARPEKKSTGTIAVPDVPPLTADMVQLCHALLAVSNCAGLVAQFMVGLSAWWSLTLVSA